MIARRHVFFVAFGATVTLCSLGAGMGVSRSRDGAETLSVRELRLVDAKGETRAIFSLAGDGSPVLALYHSNGNAAVTVDIGKDGRPAAMGWMPDGRPVRLDVD